MLLLVGFIFWVDQVTGDEVSVFPFYFLPLISATWSFGRTGGLVMGLLIVVGLTGIDLSTSRPYSHEWIRYENAGSRLIVLLVIVGLVAAYRRSLDAHRERLAALEKLLTICPGCGQIAGSDGPWYAASNYDAMREKEAYCVCPQCEAARRNP